MNAKVPLLKKIAPKIDFASHKRIRTKQPFLYSASILPVIKSNETTASHSFLKSKTTMPPNQNNGDGTKAEDGISSLPPTNDVICIADQFHFSSFYSSTNLAGLDDNNDDLSVNTPTPSSAGGNAAAAGGGGVTDTYLTKTGGVGKDGNSPRDIRSDSISIIDAPMKPHTIANPDRVKLKFYSNVLGDNSTFIHYGKFLFGCGSATCVLV